MDIHNLDIEMLFWRNLKGRRFKRTFIISSLLAIIVLIGSITGIIAFNLNSWAASDMTSASMYAHTSPQSRIIARAVTMQARNRITTTNLSQDNSKHASVPLLYNGNTYLPEVALSFDDGPSPLYTQQILAILKKYNVPAAFFCIGRQVTQYPNLVRQEYDQGLVIGNHSWSHPDMIYLSPVQINIQLEQTSQAIEQTIGEQPIFFRPPYGAINAKVLLQAKNMHFSTVLWNDDTRDWSLPGVYAIIHTALSTVGNGSIILMHDGGGNRSETVAALPSIIEGLQHRGYRIVSLQKMIDDLKIVPPGVKTIPPTPGAGTPPAITVTPDASVNKHKQDGASGE